MNYRALLAEFVGTFAIVFIAVGAVTADSITNGALGLTGIALAYGLSYGVMVTVTMAISGGHLNPAVSFGVLLSGNMNVGTYIGYVVAQCIGAVAASSLLVKAISPLDLASVNYGITAVGESATAGMATITEIVLTFMLVLAVYGTIVDKRAPKLGGLFVGLAVIAGTFMGGPISGAAMNPARWLGSAVISGDFVDWWVYVIGPLAGAALASVTWSFLARQGGESSQA